MRETGRECCCLAESAIDVPQLDPFEQEEERQFSLRLHRGASFTSMASSTAGEPPVSKELTPHLSSCLVIQAEEKKVPQAVSFSKQHSQSEATPTSPTPFTRLGASSDSSRSSGRSSDSSALSGMVGYPSLVHCFLPRNVVLLGRC